MKCKILNERHRNPPVFLVASPYDSRQKPGVRCGLTRLRLPRRHVDSLTALHFEKQRPETHVTTALTTLVQFPRVPVAGPFPKQHAHLKFALRALGSRIDTFCHAPSGQFGTRSTRYPGPAESAGPTSTLRGAPLINIHISCFSSTRSPGTSPATGSRHPTAAFIGMMYA